MKKHKLFVPAIFLMVLISSCQKDKNAAASATNDVKTKSIAFASDSLRHLNNPINNGLVGYYPFSGNANDASGYGNDGTLRDFDSQNISYGLPTLTAAKYGHPNSAYSFNGLSDYIELNNGNPLAYASTLVFDRADVNEFSIYARFKTDTAGTIVFFGDQGYNVASLVFNANRSVSFNWRFVTQTATQLLSSSAAVSGEPVCLDSKKWVDVVLNFKRSCLILYLNGTLVGFEHADFSIGTIFNNFLIGASYHTFPYSYFKGSIDEVRLYNKALTKPEIDYLLTH
jgi:Concanavalin A-like lectin/glucanases superfamily